MARAFDVATSCRRTHRVRLLPGSKESEIRPHLLVLEEAVP